MLVAAAVCPHPPLLVPPLAAGATAELDEVRAWCRDAVGSVREAAPDIVYVLGAGLGPAATGLGPWGVDVAVDVPEPLPLPLLVGAWLTAGSVRSFVVVDDALDASECASLGTELADSADRVGFVVMGDGSARHHEKAPGYLDPRAAAYDERVAGALAGADVAGLLELDPKLARDLLVAGRAPWLVLAGAARGRPWRAVAHLAIPYGVAYHGAAWS